MKTTTSKQLIPVVSSRRRAIPTHSHTHDQIHDHAEHEHDHDHQTGTAEYIRLGLMGIIVVAKS